jgi:hypothetical protein
VRISRAALTTTLLVTLIMPATLLIARSVKAQGATDDSDAKPPVAKVDLEIVKRPGRFWIHPQSGIEPTTAFVRKQRKHSASTALWKRRRRRRPGVLLIEVRPCRKRDS